MNEPIHVWIRVIQSLSIQYHATAKASWTLALEVLVSKQLQLLQASPGL